MLPPQLPRFHEVCSAVGIFSEGHLRCAEVDQCGGQRERFRRLLLPQASHRFREQWQRLPIASDGTVQCAQNFAVVGGRGVVCAECLLGEGDQFAGDRQRVALGRAIVRDPLVFLFDEPLSNLDAKLRGQMRTEIRKLHQKVRKTVVYVTHDQVEAMTLADRIVVMRDGLIEQVGTPDAVFHAPASRFVASFIGSPPMNLIDAKIAATEDGGPGVAIPEGPVLPVDPASFAPLAPGRPVTLGLRPEALSPERMAGPMAAPVALTADVTLVEPLGAEALLFMQLGRAELVARVFRPPERLRPEMGARLCADLAEMHLFDAETGRRLNRQTAVP